MLQTNSKKVNKGDIFIALKGINDDGHKYINEAISRGASEIIDSNSYEYIDNYINNNYVDK